MAAPYLAAHLGGNARATRIAEAPLLHDSDTAQWRAWLSESGVRFRAKAVDRRFEDYDLVLAAAQAGLGIALLRSPLADGALAAGGLVRIAKTAIRNVAGHYLVRVPGESREAVMRVADALLAMTAPLRR